MNEDSSVIFVNKAHHVELCKQTLRMRIAL